MESLIKSSKLEEIIHLNLTRKQIIEFIVSDREFCNGQELDISEVEENISYMDENFNDGDLIFWYDEILND